MSTVAQIVTAHPGFFVIDLGQCLSTEAATSIDGIPHQTDTMHRIIAGRIPVIAWRIVPSGVAEPIIPCEFPHHWGLQTPLRNFIDASGQHFSRIEEMQEAQVEPKRAPPEISVSRPAE